MAVYVDHSLRKLPFFTVLCLNITNFYEMYMSRTSQHESIETGSTLLSVMQPELRFLKLMRITAP